MDEFTRQFHLDHGIEVGEHREVPADPFALERQRAVENANKPLPEEVVQAKLLVNVMCGGSELNRKVKQYLEKDGKVLRYYCYWDDESDGGYRHMFHLHYFLANDSIEVIEILQEETKRLLFLKRSPSGGAISPETMRIGKSVKMGSQFFMVYDCDKFTREYYLKEFGVTLEACRLSENIPKKGPKLPIPPSTGFGSEEDSMASCGTHLVPPRPRASVGKDNLTGVILRFEARKKTVSKLEKDRKFIIAFYPVDDSLAVWEVPRRNSGFIGGKFAERGKKSAPSGNIYTMDNLFVGAILTVSGVEFDIVGSDEFTRNYCAST